MPIFRTLPGIFTIKPERSLFLYSSTYIWAKVLAHMEQKLTDTIVTTWFDDTEVLELTDQKLVLYSPTVFRKDMIVSRCETYIKDALKELFDMDLELVVLDDTEIEAYRSSKKKPRFIEFNPQFTFDNFIVGNSNKFANAAAVAVAEKPADSYNPLFIYGPSGVGKTHLLYAIANEIHKHHPDYNIVYIKGDQFTNELINSLREGKNNEFRLKYRGADLFLVDDIQFIAGKDSTQEEFFHTFNALHSAGKQIILTSDKPPKEMETLEERIRSRFEWGLMADIGTPDYETRMAILRKKIEADEMNLSDEILNYIATNIKSNIRELEGALNKLLAYSNLEKTEITMEIAQKELQNIITPDKPKEITPQLIIEVVSEHFQISLDQMISKNRSKDIARPRQIAMYLCKNMTDTPLDSIGALLGGRDHSTIIHGVQKISDEYESDETTRSLIDTIKKKINPN